MRSEETPVAWRVRARNDRGVVEHQQVFPVRLLLAEKVARRHGERLRELYRGCTIQVEPLCFYPEMTV